MSESSKLYALERYYYGKDKVENHCLEIIHVFDGKEERDSWIDRKPTRRTSPKNGQAIQFVERLFLSREESERRVAEKDWRCRIVWHSTTKKETERPIR